MTMPHGSHPPVVKTVEVGLSPQDAFVLFTEGMGSWWPVDTHSIAADTYEGRFSTEKLVFEARKGGRIYELMSNGEIGEWGIVLEWDPPVRVMFSWKPNLRDEPATQVEVTFRSSKRGTIVDLQHTGWERLGSVSARMRGAYDQGWPGVLGLFREKADTLGSTS
jgi:uncharacterized protein YndB with AHSA1/START domain